jgi:hypothetical protein
LTIYAEVDAHGIPTSWHLRLESPGHPVDQILHAGNAFSYPRAIGEIDVQGDGEVEWLVKTFDLTGHGAAWQQLGLFVARKDRLRPVRFEGEILAIRVGGISRMGEGADCEGGRVTLFHVEAEDRQNTHWSYSARRFDIDGARARFTGRTTGKVKLKGYNDPKLDPFYEVRSHDFSYP